MNSSQIMTIRKLDDPGIVTDVAADPITELVKNEIRRKEKEIYAAWRAGYDYLHVIEHIEPGEFSLYSEYIPTNYREPPQNHRVRTYDIRAERMSPEIRTIFRDYKPR